MDLKQLGDIKRLNKPNGKVDVIFDTDTFNEIDDQYALAYLINSSEKICIKEIIAAPFFNAKVKNVQEGMERSFDEIHKILRLMNRTELDELVFKGSDRFLESETVGVESEGIDRLIRLSRNYNRENPLYVVGTACATDIASAILIDPTIINRVVVVWLGGHAHEWTTDSQFDLWPGYSNDEFNLMQDIKAGRVLFDAVVPLVQLPCMGVVSGFTTTGPELEYWLRGKNALCDYLLDVTKNEAKSDGMKTTWSREIWDVTAVAWLLDGKFMWDKFVPAPMPQFDGSYSIEQNRHLIKYVYYIDRDNLFFDLFKKLTKSGE